MFSLLGAIVRASMRRNELRPLQRFLRVAAYSYVLAGDGLDLMSLLVLRFVDAAVVPHSRRFFGQRNNGRSTTRACVSLLACN